MNHGFDEIKLSAYLDGELDTADMFQIEETIENNEDAQRYVLDAIKSIARLRAGMNSVLQEEIPERLLNTIDHSERRKRGHGVSHVSWAVQGEARRDHQGPLLEMAFKVSCGWE